LRADSFDDHEVFVGAVGVDLDSLEQVVGRVTQDGGVTGTEAAGEVANGHAGAVDLAVITAEEEVHVLAVSNDGLVDNAGVRARDASGEERLGA